MFYWFLYGFYCVENFDCFNIFVIIEYWICEIWNVFVVRYGNGIFRCMFGFKGFLIELRGFYVYFKVVVILVWKWFKFEKVCSLKNKIEFCLDFDVEGGI